MARALKQRSLFHRLTRPFSHALDSVQLNSIAEETRGGRRIVIKHRSDAGRAVARMANFYFRVARIPISYWTKVRDWQAWELKWFRRLNPRFIAYRQNGHDVCIEKLPGQSLWDCMLNKRLTLRMIRAAASEFRRAHGMHCEELSAPWSHGDASMSNVIYDPVTDRARLIDFEILHDPTQPAPARHADDLYVFLLDMAGYVPRNRWLPMALAFLRAYDRPEVIAELQKRLILPGGIARIWWRVRSNFMTSRKINRRLQRLRQALERGALRHRRHRTPAAASSAGASASGSAPIGPIATNGAPPPIATK